MHLAGSAQAISCDGQCRKVVRCSPDDEVAKRAILIETSEAQRDELIAGESQQQSAVQG